MALDTFDCIATKVEVREFLKNKPVSADVKSRIESGEAHRLRNTDPGGGGECGRRNGTWELVLESLPVSRRINYAKISYSSGTGDNGFFGFESIYFSYLSLYASIFSVSPLVPRP